MWPRKRGLTVLFPGSQQSDRLLLCVTTRRTCTSGPRPDFRGLILYISKLIFVHPEVVPKFMKYGLAHLMSNFGFAPANCFDVPLVENDAVRGEGEVKHTLLRGRHTLEDPKEQVAWRRDIDRYGGITSPRPPRSILDYDCKILDSMAELGWE